MYEITTYDEEFGQIEILPSDNYDFCIKQVNAIYENPIKYEGELGVKLPYTLAYSSTPVLAMELDASLLIEKISRLFPKFDRLKTEFGYDYSTYAYGISSNTVLFFREENRHISVIWLRLDIYNQEDIDSFLKMISVITEIGNFIFVDWGWGFISHLDEKQRIIEYLNNRKNVFSETK